MKRMWLLIIFITLAIGLIAQDYVPWSNIRHSSYTSQNTIDFRCESAAALFSELIFTYKAGGIWTEVPMNNLANVTYNVSVPYTIGQDFHYLLKAHRDSLVWLTPAKITSATFPPAVNSISLIGPDPIGDCNVLNADYLDITGTYFGYSDTKFYTALENVSGLFPTNSGLLTYNIYVCGLLNPETALQDSTMFAMVYVNVPILYSSGIYKIKLSLTDFQFNRIGNVQTQVSNGKLFMSCNISDLTSDPDFGSWPNTTNVLFFDAATIQAGLSGLELVPIIADWGSYSTLSFEDYFVPAYTNHLPVLSNAYLTFTGIQNVLTVTYSDEDSNFPLTAEATLDNNQTYQLSTLFPDFSAPVEFTCYVPVSGWSNGTISFSDNNSDYVTFPISATGNQDIAAPVPVILEIYPNPFSLRDNAIIDIGYLNKMNENTEITIFNIKGQRIKQMTLPNSSVGLNHLTWNGKDDSGKYVSPGVYLCRLTTGTSKVARKFIILP